MPPAFRHLKFIIFLADSTRSGNEPALGINLMLVFLTGNSSPEAEASFP